MNRRFTIAKDYMAGLLGDPNWAVYDARSPAIDGDRWPIAAFGRRAHAKMFADMMEVYDGLRGPARRKR